MSIAPWWYEALWRIMLPLALLRLWWRGRREPGYRAHIGERLGRYGSSSVAPARPVIWIHAVSVGETRAAQPLIEALGKRFPDHRILLTHMTAAGRETGQALFGARVTQAWLPYDVSFALRRFFERFEPRFGVLMETELWPNLVLRAAARDIPLYLVNARLSQRSAERYAWLPGLTGATLKALAGVSAQTERDAQRLNDLGARDVAVAGNIKFDVAIPPGNAERAHALRERFGPTRRVWIAGSTRDGEESLLLDAMARAQLPENALMLLVPRHPQRFDEVAAMLDRMGIAYVRRSSSLALEDRTTVVLGDSMGEMLAYYAAADVAFVGGTLLPLGGQNMIEPLAVGTPVVIGPSTFNFAEIARIATAAEAVVQARDADAVVACIAELLDDESRRLKMADAGNALIAAHRGATERTAAWLQSRQALRADGKISSG
ncbi:MAG: lipid IV(A) 3-deoxy-D-manno-octulosonic acid transferase [Casimicrobiaceae bacterium]